MVDLKGKVAVVTGGARGIGRAISIKLAELGAKVVINYGHSQDLAEKLCREMESKGLESVLIKADVSSSEEARNLIQQSIEKMGKIDILVNNAGITRDNLIIRMKEEEWDTVLAVNLKGAFNCIQAASRHMLKQRSGVIVNISSVIGIVGNVGQANYSASKAGLIGLTKSCAKEFASRGVRVNAVAPGFIDTEMTQRLSEEYKEKLKGAIPLGVFGQPEDVANLVAFLVSDEAKYITGEIIKIDGGLFI